MTTIKWVDREEKVIGYEYVLLGIIETADKVERKFYLTKMTGMLKKKGFEIDIREFTNAVTGNPEINIYARSPQPKPMQKYTAVAWVHPEGGGDDYCLDCKITAENDKECEKEIRRILKRRRSHVLDDYTFKKVTA